MVTDGDRREGVGVAGVMRPVDVLALAAAPQPDHPRGRPSVKRLLQEDGANLVTFTFAPGQSFPDHSVAHPITVQCLSGDLTFGVGEESIRMTPASSSTARSASSTGSSARTRPRSRTSSSSRCSRANASELTT